jgi:CHAT domain-containing protein
MGLLAGVPKPVVGQANPPLTAEQSTDLEEAKRLNQQAYQLYKQGQYVTAIPLAERALAIRKKVLGNEHPDVATSLNNLALLYDRQGRYSEAEPLYRQALEMNQRLLGNEHPNVANSLNNLALLYNEQGRYSEAEPLSRQALEMRKRLLGNEHPDVALSLNNLAGLHQMQGRYSEAEPLFRQALEMRKRLLGNEHPDVAQSLNNLANLYNEQGRYSEAELLFRQALEMRKRLLGNEHPDVALSLNNLALLYNKQERYSEAELLFRQALEMRKRLLGNEHPDVALSLNNLAGLYNEQGRYSKAESLFRQALEMRKRLLGNEHPAVALSLTNLAGLYNEQGRYSEAESLFRQALEMRKRLLGNDHPNVATSLNNLAALYQAQGNLPRAVELLSQGMDVEEYNLDILLAVGSERQKQEYMATLSGSTYSTISLHVQAAPNNPQAARLALTTLLRRKGRILDAFTNNLLSLRQNLKPEDQTSLDKLTATYSQLAALLYKGAGDTPLDQYRQQVADLKAEINELENTLSYRSAEFRSASQPATIEAVQQLIPTDAALVELVLYYPFNPKATKPDERWGTHRYVAYILHSTGEPKWVDLGEAKPINQAVTDFRNALQSDSSDIKPVARALDELLMQPIRKLLGNTRTVLLSPDSQLNLIPFAALVDENNRYLVENYSINYLSSGRDLLRLQNQAKSRLESVIVANPDYDKPGDPTSVAIIRRGESSQIAASQPVNLSTKPAQTRGVLDGDSLQQIEFTALSYTEEEAKAIAPILPGATLLRGSQATENAIKQLQAPTILHIATHGFFRQDVPEVAPPDFSSTILQGTRSATPNGRPTENPLLTSGLALAGANPRSSGSEDGILTALEAAGLNLSGTKLLVLSACKTGLGDVKNGEGVYGLRRAFAIAGTESQLMSLWAVNDYRTNQLMVNYYQRLKNNVGRSEALRQTQLEMLQKPETQNPYYWAAFIPSGDWTPMEF